MSWSIQNILAEGNLTQINANFSEIKKRGSAATDYINKQQGLLPTDNPTFNTVTVTSKISTSINQGDLWYVNPEMGYPTSGAIPLNFLDKSNVLIKLAGLSTFSTVGLVPGVIMFLTLYNNTVGAVTLNWPASWNWQSSAPAAFNTHTSLVLRIMSYGTTDADVYVNY